MKKNKRFLFNILIMMILVTVATSNSMAKSVQYHSTYQIDKQEESSSKKEKKKKRSRKNEKITFDTFDESMKKAITFYEKQSYLSAAKILEQLYPLSMGTPEGDTVLFLFADCYMQNKDYRLAAFHFKEYGRKYPNSPRAELATLNCVKALYYLSPDYNVDQSNTLYAIDEINYFTFQYPKSLFIEECNEMLDELREKLAKKEYEVFLLYYNTENYRAVQISGKNFSKDFAYSILVPEMYSVLVKSNLEYAKKSVPAKQKERYEDCVKAFEMLLAQFPDSPFIPETRKYMEEAQEKMNKIKAKK